MSAGLDLGSQLTGAAGAAALNLLGGGEEAPEGMASVSKMVGFYGELPLKWIWGYPYLRKPPY